MFTRRLLVIAKINGQYRSLCAAEHQWLHGDLAVSRCLRVLEIFQAVENRIPIQQELLSAQNQPGEFWISPSTKHRSSSSSSSSSIRCLFPFMQTCLVLGTCFNPTKAYYDWTESMALNNDVGGNLLDHVLTFIDISQLDDVRYGFVHFHGSALKTPTPARMAMSVCASTYLWACYEENVEEERLRFNLLLSKFRNKKVIDGHSLRNFWPRFLWWDENTGKEAEEQDLVCRGTKTLRATVMDITIKMALREHYLDMGLLLQAELVPGFLDSLSTMLYEQADTLVPTRCTLHLLTKAVQGVSGFSLGPFCNFGLEDLCIVISGLEKITALNLSNIGYLDKAGLRKVLQITPVLQNLYIMENPRLPLASVLSLLHNRFFDIENLYHSGLFRGSLQCRRKNPIPSVPLKFPTGANTRSPVVQILWVSADTQKSASENGGLTDWDSVAAELIMEPQDTLAQYGVFPLNDVLIRPMKIITGLIRCAKFALIGLPTPLNIHEYGLAAAASFAMAPYAIKSSDSQVGPVPHALALLSDATQEPWPLTKMLDSKPGDWSIIIIDEFTSDPNYHTKWQYAFVTPHADDSGEPDGRFVVKDMSAFLAEVVGDATEAQELNDFWEGSRGQQREDKSIEPCSERDALEVLRTLFLPSR